MPWPAGMCWQTWVLICKAKFGLPGENLVVLQFDLVKSLRSASQLKLPEMSSSLRKKGKALNSKEAIVVIDRLGATHL